MGLGPRLSKCSHDTTPAPVRPDPSPVRSSGNPRSILSGLGGATPAAGNPDPRRFRIDLIEQIGGHVIATITYPDATNYEGRKIVLYRDTTVAAVEAATVLDPHFCDSGHLAPFARFEPTTDGWVSAAKLAELL